MRLRKALFLPHSGPSRRLLVWLRASEHLITPVHQQASGLCIARLHELRLLEAQNVCVEEVASEGRRIDVLGT